MTVTVTEFYIKEGNRSPSIEIICKDEDQNVIPLTAATSAVFKMTNPGGSIEVTGTAVIADVPGGKLRYDWVAGDVDTPGDYNGEFIVTWNDGKTTSFPNFRYIGIKVVRAVS